MALFLRAPPELTDEQVKLLWKYVGNGSAGQPGNKDFDALLKQKLLRKDTDNHYLLSGLGTAALANSRNRKRHGL